MVQKAADPTTNFKGWTIVNERCAGLKFEEESDYVVDAPHISSSTAIFTTANARMRLYSMLDWLHPSQICYRDADSVMFIYNENNALHKQTENNQKELPANVRYGNFLGELEYEMKEGERMPTPIAKNTFVKWRTLSSTLFLCTALLFLKLDVLPT